VTLFKTPHTKNGLDLGCPKDLKAKEASYLQVFVAWPMEDLPTSSIQHANATYIVR